MTHVCSTEGLNINFSLFDSIYTLSIWIRISILMSTLVIIHRLAKYLRLVQIPNPKYEQ